MTISPAPTAETGSSWHGNTSETGMEERASGLSAFLGKPRKGRGFILAAGMAVLGVGALVLANAAPHYAAQSVVLAGVRTPTGAVLQAAVPDRGGNSEAFRSQLETEIQIIQSESLLSELAERLRLVEDPEFNAALAPPLRDWIPHWLHSQAAALKERLWPGAELPADRRADVVRTVSQHISVQQMEDSGTLAISAWSTNPDRAALLANTLAELYVRRALDEKVAVTGQALAVLRGHLGQLQQSVASSSKAIEQYRNRAGLVGRNEDVAVQEPAELRSQVPPPRMRSAAVEALAAQMPALPGAPDASLATLNSAPGWEPDGAASSLKAELRAAADRNRSLRLELAALERQFGDRNQAANRLDGLRGEGTATRPSEFTGQEQREGDRQTRPAQADPRILHRAERPTAGFWPPKFLLLGFTGLASAAVMGFFLIVAGRTRVRQAQGSVQREFSAELSEGMAGMDGGTNISSPAESAPEPAYSAARRQALRQAFTPANPQHNAVRFVGRREQLARIRQAIMEEQAHVCLCGERGRGKTSLANLATEAARAAGFTVARYSCTAESDFEDILRGLARSLPDRLLLSSPRQTSALIGCEAMFPPGPLQPWHVLALPGQLVDCRLILMVDEFDRLPSDVTRTRIADTIKLLSEHAAPVFFFIIGASDSLEQLLGRHPSIQRSVVGVSLPLLTNAEVEEIVLRGARHSGLEFSAQVRTCIAALARGVPYHAQLLALRAGQAALDRGDMAVSAADLRYAIERTITEAAPRVIVLYEALTQGEKAGPMTSLLRAIAAGEQDRFGRFRATYTPEGRITVAGTSADPGLWARLLDTGAVRRCIGAGADIYSFAEANFAHYVLLRMVRLVLGFEAPR